MLVSSNYNRSTLGYAQRPLLVAVVSIPTPWDSLIQDFAYEEQSTLPDSVLSGLMANFSAQPAWESV